MAKLTSSIVAGDLEVTGFFKQSIGGDVASATSITPTAPIFKVTGTTSVATIVLPYTDFVGTITVIPTGIFSTTTAGNIANVITTTANVPVTFTYNSVDSKWYAK